MKFFGVEKRDWIYILYFSLLVSIVATNRVYHTNDIFELLNYAILLFLLTVINFTFLMIIFKRTNGNVFKRIFFVTVIYLPISLIYYKLLLSFYPIEDEFLNQTFTYFGYDVLPIFKLLTYEVIFLSFILLLTRIRETEEIHWKSEKDLIELRNQNLMSEYNLKLSKVDPDFFYKALVNTEKLLDQDKELADHYIVELSKFYRSKLQFESNTFILLTDEIDAIKRLAFLSDESITINIKESIEGLRIANGLLLMIYKEFESSRSFDIEIENENIRFTMHTSKRLSTEIKNFIELFYEGSSIKYVNNSVQIEVSA